MEAVRATRLAVAADPSPGKIHRATIYTDGGCVQYTKLGGWGAAVYANGYRFDLHGGATQTTNNRMELHAVIEALKFVNNTDAELTSCADSEYVRKGITEHVESWKFRGWRLSSNKEVKNKDLWIELDRLVLAQNKPISWFWVRGHSGSVGNEIADQLATAGRLLMEGREDQYREVISAL